MAARLGECLRTLHTYLDDSQPTVREQIEITIEDVKQICEKEISDSEIDYTCSLLFDQDTGIVSFLKKTASSEELQNGKAGALSLLSEFIQRVGKKILPYAVDIKDVCISVYSRDRFAKTKNAAVPVLIKLLELTATSSMGEDLQIDKLIQKFFSELTKASKLTSSVKASIYNLLGVTAEVYPDVMTPYSERLVGLYVSALKAEMTAKTKKPELSIIAGCLEGLTSFMLNFTQSAEEESRYSYEIYKYARMAIDPGITYTRYDVPRAGLKLFARHAGQFRKYLMDEYESMYKKFQSWSHHSNYEVLHLGIRALEAFMKEVSEELVERAKEGQKEGAVFKFFLLEFRNIMNSKESSAKEVSMALRGYGLLAAPCRTFLSEADVQYMLGEMINKCEHQFFSQGEDLNEKLISIPVYLTSLANIIRQVDSVSALFALVLERLMILLIENIPQVSVKQHFVCFKSILTLLLTLMGKATVFQQIISSVVYQGLIRTCSHPLATETAQLEETEGETKLRTFSYKDYMSLWTSLLRSASMKDLAAEDFTIADRTHLTKSIYNELMGSILKILTKLDLNADISTDVMEAVTETTEEKELLSADPTLGVIAKRPKDFQIFINLVDFCRDLLPNNHWHLFHRWLFTFTHSLVVMSTRHPLVSGFYKLLSVVMTLASKLSYFKDLGSDSDQDTTSGESMETDGDSMETNSGERLETYCLIKKFSKEVLKRMKQYQDDLLASCLTLILSLPREIIADQMSDIVPAVQTTFTIGLSYLPLANIGLDALEYWSQHLPPSVIEPYYADILPCLDTYLRTNDRGSEEVNMDPTMSVKSKKSNARHKVPVRIVREKKVKNNKETTGQLSQVKSRILRYLGSLGGLLNHNLLAHSDKDISEEAVAWDSQNHLKFNVPFFDMKPAIYFDPFLPQVVKLAQQSSDRQTKVAACELLHSLVLFALGKGAQMSEEAQGRYPMEKLYRKLFPSLLSLACDVEQVCKDLFKPLVMQLIHWFTSKKMSESPETMALLDCIFDALIQPTDTGLRDFSAKCLREFFSWSLKQISKKTAEKNPVGAKSVLKRVYSYALHPNAFKRLGAALAFNNIYMVFREEQALVDRFTFELLVYLVESLAIAHQDGEALGTQAQGVKALDHLERIIKVKVEILKKDPGVKIRPEPRAWNSRKLEFAVRWLTRQCGNPQTECRHACMKLVFNLCTLLPGVKSPKNFFAIVHKAEGAQYFLKRFEGGGHASSETHGLLAYPTLCKLDGVFTLSLVRQWFDMMLAALDCYCWVFGEDLMTPTQLFGAKGSEMSCFFKSLVFFLDKLALTDIHGAASLFPTNDVSDPLVFTPSEREEYNRAKCTAVIRIWNFLSVLLAKHSKEVAKLVPSTLWSENLWKLLCSCVVRPTTVGFNMADTEIMLQLPKEMKQVLQVMVKFLPAPQLQQLKSSLIHQLEKDCNITSSLPINLTSAATNHTDLAQMVEGYRQLHSANLLVDSLSALQLFDNVFEGIVMKTGDLASVSLSPAALNLAKSLLELSFELGLSAEILVKKLLVKDKVQGFNKEVKVSHGDLFFTVLSPIIAAHISTRNRKVIAILMDKASVEFCCVSTVLLAVLDHVTKDRTLRKKEGTSLCKDILCQWTKLKPWWQEESTQETKSVALLVLSKLFLIDSKCASDPSSESFESVFQMYLTMLKDPRTEMTFKNQTLDLLPFFASLKDKNEERLKDTLNRYVADNFPLRSKEFAVGTQKYKDYILAIDKILAALELTGSLMLLDILISIFCREDQHVHEDAIQEGIGRFVQRLPSDQEKLALDVPFAIFAQEGGYPPEIRRATIERVCLPMLRLVSSAAVTEFFINHIHELTNHLDIKLNKASEGLMQNQLTSKICSFQLLEVMYARLGKDHVNSKSSAINQRFCHGVVETGKELTQKITKAAQEAKSEDTRGETMLADLRRQYHCHAYNLMIAIISCVQTDIKFYKGFLFQENAAKGQFLLDNIIDKEHVYEFSVELQEPLKHSRKFVSIRNEAKEKKTERIGRSSDTSPAPSLHLASQYLADSSLSDEINQYDFNISNASQIGSYGQAKKKSISRSNSEESQSTDGTVLEDYVILEMDALNQHICMASLIALIKHMTVTKISPEPEQRKLAKEMPPWMPYLHEKLTNHSSHINIKLFIAKLIMNTSQIFQPYAKFWLQPLCQLLFSSEVSEGGITTFFVDLIVTMLSWHTTAIPEDSAEGRAMASRVVKFLTANIYHPNRQVFRNNLELLKTLLECWHDRIEIPYDTVYNLLKTTEPKSTKSATGVQVLGVVLTEKFPPYGPSASVDRDRYLNTLSNLMNHHLKIVFAAAAEVIGLVFHQLTESSKEVEGPFHDNVTALLTGLSNSKVDNFLVCVHCIHKSYKPLTRRFMNKLLYLLPSLHGQFRAQCLEVILGHIDQVENAFLEINSKGLVQFLTHRDEDTQLMSLKIVKALMLKLKTKELLSLLPSVTSFSSHSSPACRMIMLEILMWTYDNFREEEDADSGKIMSLTKEALLKGLCDEDLACRLVCQNFWSSNTRLPEGTLDRTVSMLEAMYSPNTEPHYLAYATNLLLEATSKSPDYQREIFEYPLSECKFQDYSVHSSWRLRHAVMTPLFANTLVSQSMDIDEGADTLEGGLRATQDVAHFTPTLDATDGGKAFNWLTQSSLDTFTETGTIGGDSQLLFRVAEDKRSLRASSQKWNRVRDGGTSGKKTMSLKTPKLGDKPSTSNTAEISQGSKEDHSDVWRLKRRFLKDKDSQRLYHQMQNIRRRKMREEAAKDRKDRRESQVTLYRKYRIGDLPDIQIKYQYIIAPLQALAHRDSTVARLLFSSLFQAIFSDMDTVKTEREVGELIGLINKSLGDVMSQSVHYFPPFMGCLLNILYELRSSLKVPASELAISAMASNQQTLGIIVLEEQLIQSDPSQTASCSKRAKSSRDLPSVDTALWIELSRLYKSIREFDVIQGIFGDKLGTKEITHKAIEAEARGDYKTAKKLYDEAIKKSDWPDGDPLEVEVDFWDDSRMECLDYLADWRSLEEIAVKGVDNSEPPNLVRVWEDGFYQEHYLPYVIRSKLKMMLTGNPDQQPLLTFVDNAMSDEAKKQHLQGRYCTELALLYLWQEDFDRSRYYMDMAFESFAQDWCNTTTFMESYRKASLHTLQGLVELQEFLDHVGSDGADASLPHLINQWEKRSPHMKLDPVTVWDDIVTNRTVYVNHFLATLSAAGSENDSQNAFSTETRVQQLNEMKLWLRLAMANSCKEQNNFTLTFGLLKNTHEMCKQCVNQELLIEWIHLYAKTHGSKAMRNSLPWADDIFGNIITTLDQLEKHSNNPVLREKPHLRLCHDMIIGQSFDTLAFGLLDLEDITCVSEGTRAKIAVHAKADKDSEEQLFSQLVSRGYESFKAAASLDVDVKEERKSAINSPDANLELAKFCDKYLHLKEDDDLLKSCDLSAFPETVVVCLLKAIKDGVSEARERFPRLLQMLESYPEVIDVFIKKTAEIPSWMFLLWVSQMTALLDKPESKVIAPLLERIAVDYPEALIYPFRMSYEGFSFGSTAEDKRNMEKVNKLSQILNIPLIHKFICALEQFGQPDMIFKDWCSDMKKLLSSKKKSKDEVKKKYKELQNELLNVGTTASVDPTGTQTSYSSTTSTVGIGEFRKGFALTIKSDIDKAFGKDGEKLMTMSVKEFRDAEMKINNVFGAHRGQKGKLNPPTKLKEYCPWMAEFSLNRTGKDLEIPGQYDGLQKPMPEYHVKIAGFDERVLVMSSLRKPKRIMIRGNDERDYPYLVKSGEDLRMDQRIETLFYIMNKVMNSDPACRQRKLHLKTYQVVSMTPRVGLIEWMRDTHPLKNFLYEALSDEECKYMESDQGPSRQHSNWVSKLVDKNDRHKFQVVYDRVYMKYSYTETVKEFRQKEGKVPWDLSRRALKKMSSSPEAFHVLRTAMITSHAVICVCQYLLGIGDRHLSNFMINLKTGHMIGIDFGHAFGSATQFLPVPELMPFRLTRQLTNLNMPLQVKGQMESTMKHVLRALRADSDLLLSTMDVFVKEPSLDWLNFAERQMQEVKNTEDDDKWYPKQKIQFARRKLRGDHPCHIMKDELALGHSKRPAFKSFTQVLMGDKKEHLRAQLPAHGLTVEDQVAALVDHATDPNILGRTWAGWEPWV